MHNKSIFGQNFEKHLALLMQVYTQTYKQIGTLIHLLFSLGCADRMQNYI